MSVRYPIACLHTLILLNAAAQSFERIVNAPTFSIEPVIRSSQLVEGDGSALLATNAMIGTFGSADMLLQKLNADGEVVHDLQIGDIGGDGYHDVGMEIVQLGADYFICGYTRAIDTAATPTFTSFLIKVDTALNLQWQMNYILPGPMELYANAMTTTDNGQFLIAGQIYDGSDFHTMLMKVAADGSIIWMKQYAIDNGERVHCVRELPGGDILLSGNVIFGFELVLPFAFKVDPIGDLVWGKYFNYPPMSPVEHSNFLFIHAQGADDILLCGHTDVLGVGGEDFYVVDIDPSGSINWAHTYGGVQAEWPSAGAFDATANEVVMLGGSSSWSFTFQPTATAMRIATDGTLIDARLYGDTSTAASIGNLTATRRMDTDSRMLMGWRGFPADDIYIAGTDNDLSNDCNMYPVPALSPLVTTTTGDFTAVITTPAVVLNDLVLGTASFASDTLLCDTPTGLPQGSLDGTPLLTALPNPASGDLQLQYSNGFRAGDVVELIDPHGRIVRSLRTGNSHQLRIERGASSPGVYLARLLRGGAQLAAARVMFD